MTGNLDGRNTHTASSTVNEHTFTGLKSRQMFEGIPSCKKYRRNSGGGLIAPSFGHTRHRMDGRNHVAGKTRWRKAHNPVSHTQVQDACPHARNDAGKFKAKIRAGKTIFQRVVGQKAHGQHHITEIEPGSHNAGLYLHCGQRTLRIRLPGQIPQPAGHRKVQAAAFPVGRLRSHGRRVRAELKRVPRPWRQYYFARSVRMQQLIFQKHRKHRTFFRRGRINQRAAQLTVFIHDDAPQASDCALGWSGGITVGQACAQRPSTGQNPQSRRGRSTCCALVNTTPQVIQRGGYKTWGIVIPAHEHYMIRFKVGKGRLIADTASLLAPRFKPGAKFFGQRA